MTDSTASTEEPTPPEATPAPWGEDFDPARAWSLVQNLRKEIGETKQERDTLSQAAQAAADAEKSEIQRALDKVTALEKRAADAERELIVSKALSTHKLADEFRDFLTGSAEEIEAKAARLAASLGKTEEPKTEEADPLASAGKPTPALTPGHGGEETPAFDPAAIAKAARRR